MTSTPTPAIEVAGFHKRYGDTVAVSVPPTTRPRPFFVACSTPGGVQAGHGRAVGVDYHLGVDVGGDAAHGVVRRGLDGDEVGLGLQALVGADEVGDVGQLGVDLLGGQTWRSPVASS